MPSDRIAPITSVDQYSELTSRRRNGRKIKNINCYFMPRQIERMIADGCLYFEESDAGVLLYHDKGDALQLYPFIDLDIPFTVERRDRPIIAEFPGMVTLNDRSKRCIARLMDSHFVHNTTSHRLSIEFDPSTYPMDRSAQEEHGYRVVIAGQEHMEAIYAIWAAVFDPIVNPLPSREELSRQIELGNVLCAVMDAGDVAGAFQSELIDQRKELTRGAVLPQYRRRGIIQSLVYADLLTSYQQSITKHCSWVEDWNRITVLFFQKLGFDFDGKFSEQYVLK